jgi:hypothetical protein
MAAARTRRSCFSSSGEKITNLTSGNTAGRVAQWCSIFGWAGNEKVPNGSWVTSGNPADRRLRRLRSYRCREHRARRLLLSACFLEVSCSLAHRRVPLREAFLGALLRHVTRTEKSRTERSPSLPYWESGPAPKSKMSPLHREVDQGFPTQKGLLWSSSGHQSPNYQHYRHHQQHMNKTTGDMECEAEEPQHQENYRNSIKNVHCY